MTATVGMLSGVITVLGLVTAVGLVTASIGWRIGRWMRVNKTSRVPARLPLDATAYLRGAGCRPRCSHR
ncbi:hypothetical protein [Fodinicola feengrottensis]|uniref:hypothetical protein n=1 Tax=Fodinicola feengrottensis TaxID=435914 RepID=UPI0013D29C84|nr:hypothetical protein [Fodinicola feengrottensis]